VRQWLGILLLALVILGGLDTWLRHERSAQRLADGVLLPLVDPTRELTPERIRAVRLRPPGANGEWRYERRGDAWRFPAYFDAYVHGDRMGSFLDVVLSASGTRATSDSDDHDDFGVTEQQALRVVLEGAEGSLAEVLLGPAIPAPGGEESFARLSRNDLTLHLHANPIRLLGAAQPSLLDPHLLPRSERRSSITQVEVTSASQTYTLRRVLAPIAEDAPPIPPNERDRYRWILEREARVDTCIDDNVYMWLSWIRSVRFERLVNPSEEGYGLGSAGQIKLIDDKDIGDQLLVGRAANATSVYVGNKTARLVTVMPAARAHMLLTPASLLLEPLPEPNPFEALR
jgi:hypothetical protein